MIIAVRRESTSTTLVRSIYRGLSVLPRQDQHQPRRGGPTVRSFHGPVSVRCFKPPTSPPLSMSRSWVRWHGGGAVPDDAPLVTISFLQPDGSTKSVSARVGETLLQTAHRNDIDLEGACEGVCACSTCHLIFPPDLYDSLPDPSEDEEDMLDMAFGLTETSRLGCQITVTDEMDGVILEMPKATRNFYVDGHVPKPH